MPATKNINQQIETAQERIRQEQNRLKQLQGKQKEYERKARSHRLCKRHGILESMLPDLISITDEQYHTFLERAVANDYGRSVLAKIIVQG